MPTFLNILSGTIKEQGLTKSFANILVTIDQLSGYEVGEESAFFDQLIIGAFFHYLAVVEGYDPVAFFYGRKSVGDDNTGAVKGVE